MPTAAPRRCPQCRRLQARVGLCNECKKDRYGDSKRIYNSRAWKRLVDQVLSEEPLCRACRLVPPTQVDHIILIRKAPGRALDRANLQGLCLPCHAAKTRRETLSGADPE